MEEVPEEPEGPEGPGGPERPGGPEGPERTRPSDGSTDWARWKEIDTLFETLLDLEPGAWEEALDRASPDPSLRRSVLRLLQATGEPHDTDPILPAQAAADALDALAERQLPAAIGPFRPLRELGAGGMGTVYLAERTEGDFRHQVAVKVLRRGLDTDDLLARFRAERRILAGLRHPNVAHLVDGGSTSDGRPWLAMEYVEGVPLDAYCASAKLGEQARVRLVREVAAAVREVHRSLVVHRDIKPSNVLVTPEGLPKLLDFGIAKLVAAGDEAGDDASDAADDASGRTRHGHRMLTPQYAAPEQRAGLPVTTATDVYQLGLLLQAVLAGKGTEDPEAPGVHGDLRRVVAMATHEDPLRRYRDAGALVEELDRWLSGRPIVARPDTLVYRTTRFLQRHRWVAPAAAVVVLLLGGWGWSLVTGAEALREERDRAQDSALRAQLEQGRAESATAFLVELFRSADPAGGERGDTLSARTLLTRGAERIREGEGVDPAVGAPLLAALSEVASALGMIAESNTWFDNGMALAAEAHGSSSAEVASLFHARTHHLNRQRDFDRAAETGRKALEIRRALPGFSRDTLASNLVALSLALAEMGEVEAAREAAREAVLLHEGGSPVSSAVQGTVGGTAAGTTGGTQASAGHILALGQLAYVARRAGDDAEAEAQYRRLLELQLGETSAYRTARAATLNNLAQLLRTGGRLDEAEAPMRESLEILRSELGPADRTLSVSFNNLASLLAELGRLDEAVALAREHLDHMRRTLPGDHWRVGSAHSVVATLRERQGLWAEAEAERAEELRINTVALGWDHSWTTRARIRHAAALAELGRFDEAAAALQAAFASIPRIDDVPDTSALEAEARAAADDLARRRGRAGGG